jgi:hypothetical protein
MYWFYCRAVQIPQHKSQEDRLAAARRLKEETGIALPVFVDRMDNNFNLKFATWPERA